MFFEDNYIYFEQGQKYRLNLGTRAHHAVLVFMEDGSFWPKGWLGRSNLPRQLREKRNKLVDIILGKVI